LYTNPSGGNHSVASPLLQLAATRGRLMELLALKLRPGDHAFEDHAFMCGIMSLMPALMGTPMEEILRTVNFNSDVREALESRTGSLGTMLGLAEALEGNDIQLCSDLTQQLSGIDVEVINACLTQALTWASNIGQENS